MTYDEFQLSQSQIETFAKIKGMAKINQFIKRNGIEPNDLSSYYTLTEKEIEDKRRQLYAHYLSNNSFPENIQWKPLEKPVYNDWVICTYNVTTTSEPTAVFSGGTNSIGTMLIDDEQINPTNFITFNSIGTHVVKFLFKDTTRIPNYSFYRINTLKKVVIPSSVISIGDLAFADINNLKTIYCFSLQCPSFKQKSSSNYYNFTFYAISGNGCLYYPQNIDYSMMLKDLPNWTGVEMKD